MQRRQHDGLIKTWAHEVSNPQRWCLPFVYLPTAAAAQRIKYLLFQVGGWYMLPYLVFHLYRSFNSSKANKWCFRRHAVLQPLRSETPASKSEQKYTARPRIHLSYTPPIFLKTSSTHPFIPLIFCLLRRVRPQTSKSVRLSVCLSVCICVFVSVRVSVCSPVRLCVRLYVRASALHNQNVDLS